MLTRDVWDLSREDFPRTGPIESQLRFLLQYAILAPSVRNTQPWSFTVAGNTVHLFADLERELPVADPGRRELYISLGCALENLLVASEHFGFRHELRYFPDPDNAQLAATVTFSHGGSMSLARVGIALEAIVARRSDSHAFLPKPVSEGRRLLLEACQMESELRLDLIDDSLFRRWIEAFTVDADRREFADEEFREELGHLIGEGALGTPLPVAKLVGFAVSRLDRGESVAQQDRKIVESTSLLGVVSATNDSHFVHVRTGQLLERLWLAATTMGIHIQPMSQTMRRPELRSGVAELLPVQGWVPQHLFRIGYLPSEGSGHRPRRPLSDVIDEAGDSDSTTP
jgi:nitroreductase